MSARIASAILLLACSAWASAAEPCPRTALGQAWSAQCFETHDAQRRVKAAYVGRLDLNGDGMTTILIEDPRELVAVDRQGRIVIPGIRHSGDFDYPDTPRGIGRFDTTVRDAGGGHARRCGYFLADKLRIVAMPRFDYCSPFKEDVALACTDCKAYCTETECQNSIPVGGTAYALTREGKVAKRYPLPTLDNVCKGSGKPRTTRLASGAMMLNCPPAADDPFGKP